MTHQSKKGGTTKTMQKRKVAYDSGSSSDDDDGFPRGRPIPLASLENVPVRDFLDVQTTMTPTTKQKKKERKSLHASNEPIHVSKKKLKRSMEAATPWKRDVIFQNTIRSEKVTWRKFGRDNDQFKRYYRTSTLGSLPNQRYDDDDDDDDVDVHS
jgi:hypothetical protein